MKKNSVLWVILALFSFALMSGGGGCGGDSDSGGGGRGGRGGGVGTADTHPYRLSDPLQALDNLYKEFKENEYRPRGTLRNIRVHYGNPPPDSLANHIQGYANYGDYHILTHSNTGNNSNHPGYIYFHQKDNDYRFRATSPGGYQYAHPGGIQVIGDFLLGASTSDNDSLAWIYDIASLKNNESPGTSGRSKILMRWPGDTSAAAVGITDLRGDIRYSGDDMLTSGNQKKYLFAVHRYGQKVELYISYPTDGLWDSYFRPLANLATDKSYDGIALTRDTNDDVWMFAFRGESDGGSGFFSWVDVWKLTDDVLDDLKEIRSDVRVEQRLSVDEGFQLGVFAISTRYGTGLAVKSDTEIVLTATQRNIYTATPYTQYNTFEK